eukprot:13523483-Ditylum_brightwellii.AAC.1
MRPDLRRGLEVYVDASFEGEWGQAWSDEPTSVLSRTGSVIKYANCPMESTRISGKENAEFKCKVHEDNEGFIELAKCPGMRLKMKH